MWSCFHVMLKWFIGFSLICWLCSVYKQNKRCDSSCLINFLFNLFSFLPPDTHIIILVSFSLLNNSLYATPLPYKSLVPLMEYSFPFVPTLIRSLWYLLIYSPSYLPLESTHTHTHPPAIVPVTAPCSRSCKFSVHFPAPPSIYMRAHPREQT